MTERSTPREFPDPRDVHGRLVRCETKIDGLTFTLNSIDVKVSGLTSHVDTGRGAVGFAQYIGTIGMMIGAAVTGAAASSFFQWLHH